MEQPIFTILLRKPYGAWKSPGKKCDCAYCNLRGESSQKSKTAANTSLVANPKHKAPSSHGGSFPLVIGDEAVTIGKKTPSENGTTEPENPGSTLTKKPHPTTGADSGPPRENLHKCVCGNSYSRWDHLQRHVRYSCEMVRADSLKTVAAAPEPKIKCECGERFDCVYSLVRHNTFCARRKPLKPFKCECGSVFDRYESLVEHQKTDCDSKKKDTSTCSLVKIPKMAFSKDLPYPCPCGRKFARVCDLSRHKIDCDLWDSDENGPQDVKEDRTVLGKSVGNFSCDCGEVFTARGALFSHQNESCSLRENNSKEPSYGCVCGQMFSRACHLGRHQGFCSVAKAPPKPEIQVKFDCVCGSAFTGRDVLMRHQQICKATKGAAGGDRVKCGCGKMFSRPDAMAIHQKNVCVLRSKAKTLLKTVSGKNSKQCKCGAIFTMTHNLRRHILKSCPKYKRKPKAVQATIKRKHENIARGSKVVSSKRWGTVRGPPFICKCKASYATYSSYFFHRNKTCPLSSGGSSQPQSNPKIKRGTINDPPKDPLATKPAVMKPHAYQSSSTEEKFTCPCGRAFDSILSRNGHRKHCSRYLSLMQSMEQCPVCKVRFTSRKSLVRHVKNIHDGVSNIKVGAKVKKIVAKSPKPKPRPQAEGLVIASVQSLANSS